VNARTGLIRGLSLTQPWASLVAIGAKEWETRSWDTAWRGYVAIHASKRYPAEYRSREYEEPFLTALKRGLGERAHSLPTASIIAVGELTACRPTRDFAPIRDSSFALALHATSAGSLPRPIIISDEEHQFGDYGEGRFAFRLENVLPLRKPIACKGALGLWIITDDVLEQIREQFVELRRKRREASA
jgi:hypothetical protein